MLTGDDPKAGDPARSKQVFDINSATLIETARRLRDDAALPTGRQEVGGKAWTFFLGAADVPMDPPADWQAQPRLAGKVKSGAQFVQTQFCMDAGIVRRYVGRLETSGPDAKSLASSSGRQSAALGQVGRLDEKSSVRHHHLRTRFSTGAWREPPTRARRHPHLPRTH